MKYKALICDVDGTLIPNREDGMPSKAVKEAIRQAQRTIPVGVATARSFTQVRHIIEELALQGPCIITSGSQIYNPSTKSMYLEKLLSHIDTKTVAQIATKMKISLTVVEDDGHTVLVENAIPDRILNVYTEAISHQQAQEFMERLSTKNNIALHKTLTWTDREKVHITVTHAQASKQQGILTVAAILGITTQEIIAIGEGYNDFPLLMASGLKVAMGNAVPDVMAIADYIAPSVDEDGVADVIKKFVLS